MIDATVTVPEPSDAKDKFQKCTDTRGRKVEGLWARNGRFYAQMHVPGKGTRRVPLFLDDDKTPVSTISQAVAARNRLLVGRDKGELPGPRMTPTVTDFSAHYVSWLEKTMAKSPLTIKKEESSLKGWAARYGKVRLNQITGATLNEYALYRTTVDKVSNRAVNLDMIALGNMLHFAKKEGWIKGEPVTETWEDLKYVAPKRSLLSRETLDRICAEALSTVKRGDKVWPKHYSGQFLADYVKLLAFSGARRQAGLSARWDNVDFLNRQITFFTKFDKKVVVDFNPELEAHLKDMYARRDIEYPSPWLFPSPRTSEGPGYMANPQKVLERVCSEIGLENFKLHDLRHYFLSMGVQSGVDVLTLASWVGHSDGGKLVLNTYGHLDPKHKRDSAGRMDFTGKSLHTEAPATRTVDLSQVSAQDLLNLLQTMLPGALPTAANQPPKQSPEPAQAPGESSTAGADGK